MKPAGPTFSQRLSILRWALPAALGLLSVLYQLGPARWVHDLFSHSLHYGVEILFYGLVGPMAVFVAVGQVRRWLEEKEHAEYLARANEQRLVSITAASADAIIGLDSTGRIESWNRGAELIFGYSANGIQGKLFTDLFEGGEAVDVEFHWLAEEVRQAGFIRGHETTCRDAEGRQIAVELTATHLVDEAGRYLGMSKVDQLARANADLQKLDRMRSEFVSLVSHQLRAPLTNMHGAVEHIGANCGTMNATCVRMLSILNQQVERFDRLVRDVLNTARIESGELVLQPEPVSVLPIVQQVVEQIRARTANRSFKLPTKPGLPLVFADRDRVAEVLANLLDNADKYSPPGKEVVVEARADEIEVTWGTVLSPQQIDDLVALIAAWREGQTVMPVIPLKKHLSSALFAIQQFDSLDAVFHLSAALTQASGSQAADIQAALDLVKAKDLRGAEARLIAMLPPAEMGEELFASNCAPCHGANGDGGIGKNLHDNKFIQSKSDEELIAFVLAGREGTAMDGYQGILTPEELGNVIVLLRAWQK